MAVSNEEEYISQSLRSVLRQDYPANLMEVLISDGMSRDRTRALIAGIAAHGPVSRISLMDNPRLIAAHGLNLLLRHSRGEIIVRVDARTEIAPDYVRQCVALLQSAGADNVGGRREPKGNTLVGKAIAIAITTPFGIGGDRYLQSSRPQWADSVYLGAWRRELFERMGVFDEEMARNQDDEFNYRLRKQGGRILASPLIRSTYWCRGSMAALWRQYYAFGWWKVRVLQKHPRQMRWRQFVPSAFVASLIVAAISAPFLAPGRMLLVAIVAAYLGANLVASLAIALRNPTRCTLLLPAVFATLHLSYGLGFLAGLIHFAGAWRDHPAGQRAAANRG